MQALTKLCWLIFILLASAQHVHAVNTKTTDPALVLFEIENHRTLIDQVFDQNPQIRPAVLGQARNILASTIVHQNSNRDAIVEVSTVNHALLALKENASYFRRAIAVYFILGPTLESDIKENIKTIFNDSKLYFGSPADRLASYFTDEQWRRLLHHEFTEEEITTAIRKTQALFTDCFAENQRFLAQPLEVIAQHFEAILLEAFLIIEDNESIDRDLIKSITYDYHSFFVEKEEFRGFCLDNLRKGDRLSNLLYWITCLGISSICTFGIAVLKSFLFDSFKADREALASVCFLAISSIATVFYLRNMILKLDEALYNYSFAHALTIRREKQNEHNKLHEETIKNNILSTIFFADINSLGSVAIDPNRHLNDILLPMN